MPQEIHALVVDDSAVVRQMLSEILRRDPRVTVSVAAHPLIALEKMQRSRPHVIVLDLEMPEMDGLSFLEKLMASDPIPVVVCSGLAARGTDAALRAIDIGAVAVIEKPRLGVKGFLLDSAAMFHDTVIEARGSAREAARRAQGGRARVHGRRRPGAAQAARLATTTDKILARRRVHRRHRGAARRPRGAAARRARAS